MSLSILPTKEQDIRISKLFNVTISNLLLPIYSVLLSILYVYLGRILFYRVFPSNEVNLFVSISSLLFMFLSFSLMHRKGENKFIDFFLKFGGIAVIPPIIMQFVSIYIRVSEYGLISKRYLSIVLNTFSLIFAIMILIRKEKGLKESLLILSTLLILITMTPLNIFDIPMIEQKHRLKTLLLNNGMLVDGHISKKDPKDISDTQGDKIIESFLYLKNNRETSNVKCEFINEDEFSYPQHCINKVFGFSGRKGDTLRKTRDCSYGGPSLNFHYNCSLPINLSGYNKIYRLGYDQLYINDYEVFCNFNGSSHLTGGFYNYLKHFYDKNVSNSLVHELIEYESNDSKFVISRGSVSLDDQCLHLIVGEGFLLTK